MVPFLSLLSKRNNILIKNKNTKRHNKKGKVPSSIERRLFGLFLLSYFSISATHSRSFVCSRQIVEEKKELFFLSLSKAPERTRKERDEKRKKSFSFFLFFWSKRQKPPLQESQKNKKKKKKKKNINKKGEEDKRWCRDTFWFKWRTRWIVIDSLRIYPSRGELWTRVLTFYEAHEPRHFL